jgi:hypothetical protein
VLYVQAGILEEREGGQDVMAAVLGDESLSEHQKQVILDIYDAFRRENAAAAARGPAVVPDQLDSGGPAGTAPSAGPTEDRERSNGVQGTPATPAPRSERQANSTGARPAGTDVVTSGSDSTSGLTRRADGGTADDGTADNGTVGTRRATSAGPTAGSADRPGVTEPAPGSSNESGSVDGGLAGA